MTNPSDLGSTTSIRQAILRGDCSVEEVAHRFLERIELINPLVGAIEWVLKEQVLQRARHLDRLVADGLGHTLPLLGLPMTLPDSEALEGAPFSQGAKLLRSRRATRSSDCAEQLLQAGVLFVGKGRTAEFSYGTLTRNSLGGECRNPWDMSGLVLGPSGGGAAAVATGMALAALETDAYGSLRLSSAGCGLFGLKTGRAATPLREDLLVPSYERRLLQRGVISRTPEELRHVARVLLCGQSAKGLETDSSERAPLKVAWSADLGYIPCQDGVQSQMEAAIERFKGLGADVERIELDLREDTAHHLHHLLSVDRYLPVIQLCEAYPDYFASLSSETRDWLAVGNAVSGVQYSMACSYMVWLRRHVLARLKGYDVLLTPVSPLQDLCGYDVGGLPSCVGGALFDAQLGPHSFLLPFNLIGLPAMTLPCGLSEQGHPQAVQVLGNRGREVTLMALADAWDEQGEYSLLAPEIAKMPY